MDAGGRRRGRGRGGAPGDGEQPSRGRHRDARRRRGRRRSRPYDATIQKNDAIDNAASTFAGIGLPGELRDYFSISLGIGIWLCIAGGVVAIVAGIMAMMSQQPERRDGGRRGGVRAASRPRRRCSDAASWTGMPEAAVHAPERRAPRRGRRAGTGDRRRPPMSDVGVAAMPEADVSTDPDAGLGDGRARASPETILPPRPDVRSVEIEVDTSDRRVVDVTDHVRAFAADGRADGLLHVFVPHATAGVALMETGSGSERRPGRAARAAAPARRPLRAPARVDRPRRRPSPAGARVAVADRSRCSTGASPSGRGSRRGRGSEPREQHAEAPAELRPGLTGASG